MPIIHDVEQYSDAYDQLRRGIPTASQFDKIITPGGKPSASWKKYAYHLIAERFLGRKVDSYTSPYMERGLELESDSVEFYEMMRDVKAERVGFITTDDKLIGCSPDRLIGEDGLLECKVPAPATHVEYLLSGEIDQKYKPQCQGQLFVSDRKWVDILSYHPEMPPVIIRVERDPVFIACLENLLWEFNSFLREVMTKIESLTPKKGNTDVKTQIQF